jgi:hypothetical protein
MKSGSSSSSQNSVLYECMDEPDEQNMVIPTLQSIGLMRMSEVFKNEDCNFTPKQESPYKLTQYDDTDELSDDCVQGVRKFKTSHKTLIQLGSPRANLDPEPKRMIDYECRSDIVVGGDFFFSLD